MSFMFSALMALDNADASRVAFNYDHRRSMAVVHGRGTHTSDRRESRFFLMRDAETFRRPNAHRGLQKGAMP